ncbi:hypothetical protein CBOM_01954 [Ceraceosorus bombacis]|uniref:Uncharacterized protein n=1 Tax=Ceraceosorus bombacis TaxID=401625 RepID=A0A0P1BDN3_9BASI|nr:hypothetical protein CBOM_01003 [Ceraceosorus bombacis]CEH14076.1 hypothetical protein CBOM_01954 [Ceraceosorus bombacis]
MNTEHPSLATHVKEIMKNANSYKPEIVAIAKALQRAFKPVQKRKRNNKPLVPEKNPLTPEKPPLLPEAFAWLGKQALVKALVHLKSLRFWRRAA